MIDRTIRDQLHDYYSIQLSYTDMLVDEQTDYQHIQVVTNSFFGKVLLLDGIIQLTELDNPGYHEMIVHVPLLAVGQPRKVLVVGGGDGGALQQVLRYPSVKEAVICELDRRVVEVCRQHFPGFGDPFADPRARLVIQDAFYFLRESGETFDAIIADTTDPIGEAEKLFSEEFYRLMVAALNPGGAITTQCEQMYFDRALIKDMVDMARGLVKHPAYYYTLVPTYPGGEIGCLYLSDTPWEQGLDTPYPPGEMHYLNPGVHRAAFALPEFLRKTLE